MFRQKFHVASRHEIQSGVLVVAEKLLDLVAALQLGLAVGLEADLRAQIGPGPPIY
jgi:hypothetical protein